MRNARYAGVRKKGHLAIEFGNRQGSRRHQDLGHPAGDRAQVTQYDDHPGLDPFGFHCLDYFPGIVETKGRASKSGLLHAGNFENHASGSEISKTDLHVGERF